MENITTHIAEENALQIRTGYAAFNAGDMKTLAEIFQKDASWHSPGKNPIAGDFKGMDAVFAQFGRYGSGTDGTFKAILQTVAICDDGRLVGIHRNTAERKGRKLDVNCCLVFEFKDGLVMKGTEYIYDQAAWDAFWA